MNKSSCLPHVHQITAQRHQRRRKGRKRGSESRCDMWLQISMDDDSRVNTRLQAIPEPSQPSLTLMRSTPFIAASSILHHPQLHPHVRASVCCMHVKHSFFMGARRGLNGGLCKGVRSSKKFLDLFFNDAG